MKVLYFLALAALLSCGNNKSSEVGSSTPQRVYEERDISDDESEEEDEYSDGTWCADVEYYNPSTGTRNTYSLDVEVEGSELVQIDWPNGGWLDETHFTAEDISSGECNFTSDRGYEYTVTLIEKGGCGSSDTYRLRRDIEEDRQALTCPKCGSEKQSYEEQCSSCKNKAETCPKCYGYKMEWEQLCSSCRDEIEEKKLESEDY